MKTVIMASGLGSRLWPLSTAERPKQFLPLIAGESMLAYTYRHLSEGVPEEDLYVSSLESLGPHVFEQLPMLDKDHAILVPERRNTLPHTLYALGSITKSPDEPVLFKSVDHYMPQPERFTESLRKNIDEYVASDTTITIFGRRYDEFRAGLGYCLIDDERVIKVVEKPSSQALQSLEAEGQTLQLPLIFIATPAGMQHVIKNIESDWQTPALQLLSAGNEERDHRLLEMKPQDLGGIFGHSSDLVAREIDYEFVDVGRFASIYELNRKDDNQNVIIGDVHVAGDASANLIINQAAAPLVIHSVRNSVVIQTSAGGVVVPFEQADEIGQIYKEQILRPK